MRLHAIDARMRTLQIPIPSGALTGELAVPPRSTALVLFAHGSGSSRRSPRNRRVASLLQGAGLATLLFDLLTDEEAADRRLVFDIELLAGRMRSATEHIVRSGAFPGGPFGYFGASTGAAAALVAAADDPRVGAIVSRGGRPDLAGAALGRVHAPVLLIVGGDDPEVLELNRAALGRMQCEKRLTIVPGATHLFEEPGALDEVARLAADWFRIHLAAHGGRS